MMVFVSHGWADAWVARQIARCIADCGAAFFLDVYDIESGDDIDHEIRSAIVAADELVALLTPVSRKRNWLWAEMGAAWGHGKRLVPLLYGVTRQELDNDGGAAMLGRLNYRNLNDFDQYLDELKRRIDHG
jgi:hypothetical protein